MYKKQFSHLLSFNINIPVEQFDNMIEAIQLYNIQNNVNIDNQFIRLFYDNKHFELKHKSFVGRGKRLSISKVKNLLLSNQAILYLGNETLMIKQKCIVKNKVISIVADDMYYKTKLPFKNINTLNTEISTIIAFVEFYDGDLVYTGELEGDNNILITYKNGEELHNIENKAPLCENIYAEYKIDIIYCKKGFNITFNSFIETNERTLLADDPFLQAVFQALNQYGGDIIVYENTEVNRVNLILRDTKLSELIYNHIRLDDIKSYQDKTRKYQSILDDYKDEKYVKYFNISFEAFKNQNEDNYFNIQNIYQRLDKQAFLINIEQLEEDLVVNMYSPKYAYIPSDVNHLVELEA